MKKYLAIIVTALMVSLPLSAAAHERQVFDISGTKFLFVVGSLNEPVSVDDKTGVDLRIKIADPANPGDSNAKGAKPVEGSDQTLKVELLAGGKKKVLNLAPAYNDPGAYRAPFYPTVQTTYSYRFFGTINDTPVDLTFNCNPAGHPAAVENKEVIVVSDKVSRVLQVGSFGCPMAKEEQGFPEPAPTLQALATPAPIPSGDTGVSETIPLVLSVVGIILGGLALRRRPKVSQSQ